MKTIDLNYLGCTPSKIYRNLEPKELVDFALAANEGELSDTGALVVKTGKFTGRAPKSRYIVDAPEIHDSVGWGNVNKPIDPEKFEGFWNRAIEYLNGKDVYVFDGLAGADRKYAKSFRVINELASQNLFIHQLLVRPTEEELDNFGEGDYTIVAVPNFRFDPEETGTETGEIVVLDFSGNRILIVGTGYAGEIKKAVFSTMSYIMPAEGVLPMHCSANTDLETGSTALFFGLSGTGKTTLSADASRAIVGDDEHGWSPDGIFNFEGGCYAKCIDLSAETEPEIFNAVKFGAMAENVVLDPETKAMDFADSSLTENTRVGYPIDFIPNAVMSGTAQAPQTIFFLTADAFGVLPPISRLTPNAAMYQFISGFTSKVAGTELGIVEPVPTFSSLFGEPFMPRPSGVYANMLGDHLKNGEAQVYLLNTGWAGGGAADGVSRIKLRFTRAMINAALDGKLDDAPTKHDARFNVEAIAQVPGVPDALLDPEAYWVECGRTAEEYNAQADKLAALFEENFATNHADIEASISEAGPHKLND